MNAPDFKNNFIDNVTHELRNPLAVIRANSDVALIDIDQLTKEEAIRTISENLKQADRITETLRTIQAISKQKNGKGEIELSSDDIQLNKIPAEKIIKLIAKIYDAELDIQTNSGKYTTFLLKLKK